jgi:hypothetical protein
VGVAFVPETVERQQERPAYRPQRVSLPQASRKAFFSAGAGVFTGFAIFGLFTSLAPTFLAGTLHEPSRFVAGAVTFAVFGSAAVTQVLTARMPTVYQLRLAALLMAVGLITMATAVLVVSLPLFLASGIIAGAGVGVQFRSSVAVAASLAMPPFRGEVLAALFLIAYAGLAVPVLLLGVALAVLPSTVVLLGFSATMLAPSVWASLAMSVGSGAQLPLTTSSPTRNAPTQAPEHRCGADPRHGSDDCGGALVPDVGPSPERADPVLDLRQPRFDLGALADVRP